MVSEDTTDAAVSDAAFADDQPARNAVPGTGRYSIGAQGFSSPRIEPGLYIVSTPIGNLRDITIRALETLSGADMIACEDTRVTRILLQRYDIRTPLIAYHEHNAAKMRPKILSALAEGKVVAQVSDAGTPLLSDPGYRLVRDVVAEGFRVFPIPGASAPLAALVGAGLPTDTILFAGFLPQKSSARRRRLEDLRHVPATQVFFESPRRLGATLGDMAQVLGGARAAAVARELTKKFETFERGTLGDLAQRFADTPPRGEIVIAIAPPEAEETSDADVDALLRDALRDLPVSAAAGQIAKQTGRDRRALYKRALALRDETSADEGTGGHDG
ncbi:16S rRNA (cytidine(1402)-2'-O)-methyltransferase [Breoghania sp. L-A4]|uniref:16S rRNA (cytidine(1402)-2'-O)-methyltransferase n=1 Tax=Breoghania sp. L-A4 TaxID=2304600 RepID=UPI000E3588E8|nr:16S rRNA (cytidine(1402)-2'-O)-methyltransferase [Breoghania sp. L-A4]AXS38938.1 16S rRNA (cytidine(1402)-2'-O)-methyltransferase [Breoghania sp. L-A4]